MLNELPSRVLATALTLHAAPQFGGLRMLNQEWAACAATAPPAGGASTPFGLAVGAPCADAFAESADLYVAGTHGMLDFTIGGHDLAGLYNLTARAAAVP